LGGDVDPARRFVEDENARAIEQKPLGEHDLLLVAAAELTRHAADAARTNRKRVELRLDDRLLPRAVEHAAPRNEVHRGQSAVVEDAEVEPQAVALAIFGDEGDAVGDRVRRAP